MRIIKKYLINFLNFLEKVIPKKKLIIFHSFPDYTDNSYAIFRYMIKNNIKNNHLIWLYDQEKYLEKKIFNEFGVKIKCYRKNSIKGIYSFLRAKKIFSTHGIFSFIKTKDKKINLWHGMPLKNIGFMDSESKGVTTSDYLIATSKIFKTIMSKSFGIQEEKVFLIGQPRNDNLFDESKFYSKMNIDKKLYNKVIIYLPTYRKSIIGDVRDDGRYNNERLGIIPIEKLKLLNHNLKRNNNLIIMKLHPMDILQKKKFNEYSNIIILKTKDLEKINEQLYPLLGSTDLLITDYSSVWIDYEILGKPIYFAMDDYKEYKSSRGFTIENLVELLPGDVINNFESLLKKLDNIPEKIQKETEDKFNRYKDNKSCERLLRTINIL